MNIEMNLKRMAEYRSDMFGSGTEETMIGRKKGPEGAAGQGSGAGEDEDQQQPHVSAGGGESVKRPAAGISLEDQFKAPGQPPMPPMPPMQHQQQQGGGGGGYFSQQFGGGQQPQLMRQHPMGAPPPQQQPPPPAQPQHHLPAELALDEPASKRQKTEEQLIPEAEFMAMHGGSNGGLVTFTVQVPYVSDKPEWNLNGQGIQLTLPYTELVSTIKNKLMDMLTMPIAKQKLQLDVSDFIFFKIYRYCNLTVVFFQT
jgi:splicing factor 3A subunit 1